MATWDKHGLLHSDLTRRTCPCCKSNLSNPFDADLMSIKPTEGYKSSVLSGLAPSIVMDCATRALSFYSYQTTQELLFQEAMTKQVIERHDSLESQVDGLVAQAKGEIRNLRNKIQDAEKEKQAFVRANQQLTEAYQKKIQDHDKLRKSHEKLKAEVKMGNLQDAAAQHAEQILGQSYSMPQYPPPVHNAHDRLSSGYMPARQGGNKNARPGHYDAHEPGRTIPRGADPITTSAHLHQRPGNTASYGHRSYHLGTSMLHPTPERPALNKLDMNRGSDLHSGFRGQGLSAGVKVGKQSGSSTDGLVSGNRHPGLGSSLFMSR